MSGQMLDQAWQAVAPGGGDRGELTITGAGGQLASALPAEDASIACAGAAVLAAAMLRPRSGSVGLDREHVAAAFRSERYIRVNGAAVGGGFAPLSRFWPTADGWIRTHANYPWHRDALLRALDVSGDTGPDGADRIAEGVAAALARRAARDAESEIFAAGGVAAAVRTASQWLSSPQGQAVAGQELIGSVVLDGAPARRRPAAGWPAAGIRVLDLTRVIAGPVGTRYLAALGADVLRIDSPDRPELPLHVLDGLLGKRSMLLDFGSRDGLRILHELLDQADVLVHGYRPHALDRFGLGDADLAARHPGLVVVSLSAWGSFGPWGARRGFDSIVQAACGIADLESRGATPSAQPGVLPCQLLDHSSGYLAAAAALASLHAQAASGGTHFRSLSLARTALWLMNQPGADVATAAPAQEAPVTPWLSTMPAVIGPGVAGPGVAGEITVVDPPGVLDGKPLRWPGAPTCYGSDQPAWSGTSVR